ncbi:MAG: ABC transporter ATP-binding protein [Eubacteriales bacterium]|nr:ABC transporter ATP-binding protein [Clostridiales bacterium]MDY5835642.1 ABC transporter ATP-binding protein [Eubacteriales bacterium]
MNEIVLRNVIKKYSLKSNVFNQLRGKVKEVYAVNDVSLTIDCHEITGLIGESGCGKSTLAKLILHLEDITTGEILFDNQKVTLNSKEDNIAFRKRLQLVFQDPYESLDPRFQVVNILQEPLKNLRIYSSSKDKQMEIMKQALEDVSLVPPDSFLQRYPYQLSGGQRQRVSIARALICNPEYLVADEPISMLDVSIRAGILTLLKRLQQERNIGCLIITHDLATARYVCDEIVVMYLGKIVESGRASILMDDFAHPYSMLLLKSAPDLFFNESGYKRPPISTEVMDAINPPNGCKFAPRCSYCTSICQEEEPCLENFNKDEQHKIACHHYKEIIKKRSN